MTRTEIINLIRSEREVEIPSLQKKYGIPYGELKAVIEEMVVKGELKYMGGISYEYAYVSGGRGNSYSRPGDKKGFKGATFEEYLNERRNRFPNSEDLSPPTQTKSIFNVDFDINDEEELRKRALKLCIERNSASASLLQRCLPIGYVRACRVIDWMEERGYVSPAEGIKPRNILINEEEYENIFNVPEIDFDEDDDDDDYDENPFEALEEFEQEAWKLIEENERKLKVEATRLADVIKKISLKKSQEENKKKSAVRTDDRESAESEESIPEHPSRDNEFEFIRTVRRNIELIVISDRNMGVLGATKKARDLHWEFNDRGDTKMEEVFARVIFEFEHTSPYQYAKLKKKYFV